MDSFEIAVKRFIVNPDEAVNTDETVEAMLNHMSFHWSVLKKATSPEAMKYRAVAVAAYAMMIYCKQGEE